MKISLLLFYNREDYSVQRPPLNSKLERSGLSKRPTNQMSENYKFFNHKDCEYFPCHKGVKAEDFNCLFCYCPLYCLGKDCGGNFTITNGVKNCTDCTLPHNKNSYQNIMNKIRQAMDVSKQNL